MKTKNAFIFLSAAIFLNFYSAKCQDTTVVEVPTSSFLEFNILGGFLYGNSAAINRSFKSNKLQTFNHGILNRGLSMKFSINKGLVKRFVYTLEGNIYQGFSRRHQDEGSGNLTGGSSGISVGYIVVNNPSFYLYPYLGINNNNTKIHFSQGDTITSISSIGGLMTAKRSDANLRFNNQALALGIFAERVFKTRTIGSCPKNVRYLSVGLRAGYLLKLNNERNGKHRYKVVDDSPNYGLEGPYFQLSFGYGIKLRKINWR